MQVLVFWLVEVCFIKHLHRSKVDAGELLVL